MEAGKPAKKGRPGSMLSGLFLSCILLRSAPCAMPVSEFLHELQGVPKERQKTYSDAPDTTVWRLSVSAAYHDLYRSRITDTTAAHSLIEQTAISVPRMQATLSYDRPAWGCSAYGYATGTTMEWVDNRGGYSVAASSLFQQIGASGWIRIRKMVFTGTIGYDNGPDTRSTWKNHTSLSGKILSALNDPHIVNTLALHLVSLPFVVSLYEKRSCFQNISGGITKQSNRSRIDLPLCAASQEFGVRTALRLHEDTCGLHAAWITTESAAGAGNGTDLPSKITANGFYGHAGCIGSTLPLSPWLSFSSWIHGFGICGFDVNGTDTYFALDSNGYYGTLFKAGIHLPLKVIFGAFRERFSLHSDLHGQFDPYPFSAYSIFDPVKYRLDTLAVACRAHGIVVEREFILPRKNRLHVSLWTSYIRLYGTMQTREWDFSFLIPRLINPRETSLADEKRLLLIPQLHYTIGWHRMVFAGSLRQIIPIDLHDIAKDGGRKDAPAATKRTMRGGITAGVTVDYTW
jgi:hypothetical protein